MRVVLIDAHMGTWPETGSIEHQMADSDDVRRVSSRVPTCRAFGAVPRLDYLLEGSEHRLYECSQTRTTGSTAFR